MILPIFKQSFRIRPRIGSLLSISHPRLSPRLNFHSTRNFSSSLNIPPTRKSVSWLTGSLVILATVFFVPVTLPILAIAVAAVATTASILFIGSLLLLLLASLLILSFTLVIPALKLYFDFKKISKNSALGNTWTLVNEPSTPWFATRYATKPSSTLKWSFESFEGDLENGDLVIIDKSTKIGITKGFTEKEKFDGSFNPIRDLIREAESVLDGVCDVVAREADKKGFKGNVWLEREWLYFFRFSVPFVVDP